MRLSELDDKLLTNEEKFKIIMYGIKDFELENADDSSKSDLIVVLGCSPKPLEARVKKMMALYKKGYATNILLSGGDGWQKLFRKTNKETGEEYVDEVKKAELLDAIRKTIGANLLGDNPSPQELALFDRFNEGMKEMMNENSMPSYEEEQEKRKLELTEAEFMKLIIISNGGLNGAKFFHEPFSSNTKENMIYTKRYIDSLIKNGAIEKVDRIMVVTSSFHCRRATLTFKKNLPNIEILACPTTLDLIGRGTSLGPEMMENEYYRKQINNECNALVNYAKNGSIEDAELEEFLPSDVVKSIISHQNEQIER